MPFLILPLKERIFSAKITAAMENLKKTYCRFDMVCDNPRGNNVEISHMPEFFDTHPAIETSLIHVHPFYEIVWFRKGGGVHTVDFTDYEVVDNSIFFIAPGQIHSFGNMHDAEGYVIKICSHLLNHQSFTESVLLKYNVFNTYDSVPFKRIPAESAAAIAEIVEMIEEEATKSDDLGHEDYLLSLVTLLLVSIERSKLEQDGPVFSTTRIPHRTFLAFRQAIEQNFRSLHTVKEYADLLNITTKTLTNYVSECSRFSPLEMINNRIILEAKRLLRYSDLMVKEIAAELGFDDPSYFNKFFKRLAKCTAAEYRTPE